jgi:mxaA protein
MNRAICASPVIIAAVIVFAIVASASAPAAEANNAASAASETAIVEQPRPFGYVIGDVFTQRVFLQIKGKHFEPVTLPPGERVSVWLERRASRIETTAEGQGWLAVDYQLINAPPQPMLVAIPAWQLPAQTGTNALRIAEWAISVSPMTQLQSITTDGADALRPDRPAPVIATKPIERQIAIWSGVSLLIVLTWLGWIVWRNLQTSRARPFGRALREMRRLDDKSPLAWRALHRAFDSVAGQVTQTTTLPILFQNAPQFGALQSKIEIFFEQSSAFFFGGGLPANPISVHKLCAELRRIEKRHEQ